MYRDWLLKFINHDLLDFTQTKEGLLWLKLRTIERKDLLQKFVSRIGIDIDLRSKQRMEQLWQNLCTVKAVQEELETFVVECQKIENRRIDESFETIRSNLYQLEDFHWGGGFRNSLDKAIVSRYVKTDVIIPYNRLEDICDTELCEMSRGYLLNSWYDYWSSVLIENIFRRNEGVMPAPGRIKNVDFFVDDVPFDLKVTYFPKEYAKKLRRELGIQEPFSLLKKFAKKNAIPFSGVEEPRQRYEIEQRILDADIEEGKALLREIKRNWCQLVRTAMNRPRELSKWLYENQGDMRFGAENRIFLILVDLEDGRASWKLKRNVDLIRPTVTKWINSFSRDALGNLKTEFTFKGRTYETFSDILFVCKGRTNFGREYL